LRLDVYGTRLEELDITIALLEGDGRLDGNTQADKSNSNEYLGEDGVFIGLGSSWNKDEMKLQPHQRIRRLAKTGFSTSSIRSTSGRRERHNGKQIRRSSTYRNARFY
jgi:hypothetical protein